MKESHPDQKVGKIQEPGKAGEIAANSNDLTCSESQIEEILSKGESADWEADEAGQAEKPAERKQPR